MCLSKRVIFSKTEIAESVGDNSVGLQLPPGYRFVSLAARSISSPGTVVIVNVHLVTNGSTQADLLQVDYRTDVEDEVVGFQVLTEQLYPPVEYESLDPEE